MKPVRRRLPLRPAVACARVRLVVSARADGERAPHPPALEAHLATCAPCRRFAAACTGVTPELVDLIRPVRLRPARRAPAALLALVASRTARPPDPIRAGAQPQPQPWPWPWPWRRSVRQALSWAAAAVPAGAFALALPVALSHAPAVVPTHIPTPCTIGLEAHHARPAG